MKLRGNKTPVFSCIQPLGTPQTGYIIKERGHPEKHRQERRLRHRRTESGESGAGEADRRAEGAVRRYLALKDEVKEAEQIRKCVYSILREESRKEQPTHKQDLNR